MYTFLFSCYIIYFKLMLKLEVITNEYQKRRKSNP